jgi:hypothetical protein
MERGVSLRSGDASFAGGTLSGRKASSDRAPQERRRSQRIMVQVAVLLRTETPNQGHTPTLAFTAWVNAHGGLLESPVRIRAGEEITLIIPQSRKEAGCRVLQVQKLSEDSSSAESSILADRFSSSGLERGVRAILVLECVQDMTRPRILPNQKPKVAEGPPTRIPTGRATWPKATHRTPQDAGLHYFFPPPTAAGFCSRPRRL